MIFKIYQQATLESLYTSAGNDVTSYIRSAANDKNKYDVWSGSGQDFLVNGLTDLETVHSFGNVYSNAPLFRFGWQ